MTPLQAVTDPASRGLVRVVGGPGTGKTTLLVDAVAAHVAAGADPESVLLLCGSARGAARARSALASARVRAGGTAVTRTPLVRTVHSYAFAVLSLAAQRAGRPPPRLVTGTEQDGIIRELLAGDQADGPRAAVAWPEALRPALTTDGFATQLRDLLARCGQRGVDGAQLQRIGRRARRPEWVAAGQFAQQYEQVMLLRAAAGMAAPQATVPALGAAELVGAALDAFAADPQLQAAEHARIHVLLVDDAQHLDPQAARLVRVLACGATRTILAGDPNQTAFGFRGADALLLDPGSASAQMLELATSHRCSPAIAAAVSTVAARLPGRALGRTIAGTGEAAGSVAVRRAASAHAEAALIADALRRAHLVDGVAWSQMAVIVRSLPRAGALLQRALTAAGVPVSVRAVQAAPSDHPTVHALLTVLAATAGTLTPEQAVTLLTGPIGRVDPVSLRRLRKSLRRRDPAAQIVDALTGELTGLASAELAPVRRVRAVLDAAARAAEQEPRYALWQAWHRSGLQHRWLRASARGGPAGAQADRDLDAVTALFDTADDYVARTAGATIRGLIDHVGGLQLAQPEREPAITPEAVAIHSVHAALGREWDFVVIAGLQDGLWPNTTPRDGVLGAQQLVDVMDGVDDTASRRAPVLADERRLLIAALGRARHRLLITAVDSDGGGDAVLPSPFFYELAQQADDHDIDAEAIGAPRVLAPAALIGRLRAVVCAPTGTVDESTRRCAATQLARLTEAGVPGADPAGWYGLTAVSTELPLSHDDGPPVTLSPSTVQTLADCPLRWLLERHGGADGRDLRSALGSVIHRLVADPGKTESQLHDELEKIWATLSFDSTWFARNELARHRDMLSTFTAWWAQTRHELTEVGTEVDVDGVFNDDESGWPDVRVRGRIDRLERDAAGRLLVVDLKTGRNPVTKDNAQRHAQLATYQLAVAAGLLPEGEHPGGGRLVYLGKSAGGGAVERDQDALTPQACGEWSNVVHQAAAATVGPVFLARINDSCGHCPVRSSCPAQQGRS